MFAIANWEVSEIERRCVTGGLQVDAKLHDFVVSCVLPGLDLDHHTVWSGFSELIAQTAPRIADALQMRQRMQDQIDVWHQEHASEPLNAAGYRGFLESIGYIVPAGPDFCIETQHIDPEIARIAGPQLVVPVSNERYALNAANARWGSLYDAVYGTDVLGSRPSGRSYDVARGKLVVTWVRRFLDDVFPLSDGSHADARSYRIGPAGSLEVELPGSMTKLDDEAALVGYLGDKTSPSKVLLENHGLGVILEIDRDHPVGREDPAGVRDVVIESAVTTIIDFEDSVAAIDAADKIAAYTNWLGLMRGDLSAWVAKGDHGFERRLEPNLSLTAPNGETITKRGRALLLVRNVGHLMTTSAVLDSAGAEVPETLLDAMLTVLIAMHDLKRSPAERNSATGSIYVVKPKLHGPAEVALTDEIFAIVERALGLQTNTVKLGLMDEERRTTLNLKECIRSARNRIAFINTGFLDRTGDEIHTSMEAGPMVRKADMRTTRWIRAYEDWNIDTGLACGMQRRAQIGKGMWAAPDEMAEMLRQKVGHPQAGANTAWVPSPTAATLHATHYQRIDVAARQAELAQQPFRATLDDLLAIPIATSEEQDAWSARDRQAEVDNNVQSILGYVVRWIDQGVGCSKVPDLNDVGLMEDRATCRISSQHIANWLRHGVVTAAEVEASFQRMAAVVDGQNAEEPHYEPMCPSFDGNAYRAAWSLVFDGASQPSGYTEPILHSYRAKQKALIGPTK